MYTSVTARHSLPFIYYLCVDTIALRVFSARHLAFYILLCVDTFALRVFSAHFHLRVDNTKGHISEVFSMFNIQA